MPDSSLLSLWDELRQCRAEGAGTGLSVSPVADSLPEPPKHHGQNASRCHNKAHESDQPGVRVARRRRLSLVQPLNEVHDADREWDGQCSGSNVS